MSYLQAAAIETAIYETLTGALSVERSIAAGTYASNAPQGLAEWAAQERALVTPRVSLRWGVTNRSPDSPGINSNLVMYDAAFEVVVSRTASRLAAADQTTRNAVTSALMLDLDTIRQALEYPHNLDATAESAVTDIVSGMLRFASSAAPVPQGIVDDGAQRYELSIIFTGVLISRPS